MSELYTMQIKRSIDLRTGDVKLFNNGVASHEPPARRLRDRRFVEFTPCMITETTATGCVAAVTSFLHVASGRFYSHI